MEKIVQSICKDVVNAINDDSALVGKLFGKIEQKSGRSRYQAAIVLAGVICMLLAVYNPAVKLLCDLICIVYPVMKTLAEMESIEKSRCKQWMFYWLAAIFCLLQSIGYQNASSFFCFSCQAALELKYCMQSSSNLATANLYLRSKISTWASQTVWQMATCSGLEICSRPARRRWMSCNVPSKCQTCHR
ncbi:hypothetical protein Tsp_04517 [Trichinella spiralis]|uniref:hypothetical protein n=1 Tax=Trichinella spiralis TaxID=6334 RepID=UPI0001EFEED3|nr:hypothetical protein Tsp_04517 [Trichinella spiralis]